LNRHENRFLMAFTATHRHRFQLQLHVAGVDPPRLYFNGLLSAPMNHSAILALLAVMTAG